MPSSNRKPQPTLHPPLNPEKRDAEGSAIPRYLRRSPRAASTFFKMIGFFGTHSKKHGVGRQTRVLCLTFVRRERRTPSFRRTVSVLSYPRRAFFASFVLAIPMKRCYDQQPLLLPMLAASNSNSVHILLILTQHLQDASLAFLAHSNKPLRLGLITRLCSLPSPHAPPQRPLHPRPPRPLRPRH